MSRPIQTPEGEKYVLEWEGRTKTFDNRTEADTVLVLLMARDVGRELTPEEERMVGFEIEEEDESEIATQSA
jgi:hypothetical protein